MTLVLDRPDWPDHSSSKDPGPVIEDGGLPRGQRSLRMVKADEEGPFVNGVDRGRGRRGRVSDLDLDLPTPIQQFGIDGMEIATIGEVPVVNGPNFTIYSGGNFLAKTLEGVWSGQTSIDAAMEQIQAQWQADLDEG